MKAFLAYLHGFNNKNLIFCARNLSKIGNGLY